MNLTITRVTIYVCCGLQKCQDEILIGLFRINQQDLLYKGSKFRITVVPYQLFAVCRVAGMSRSSIVCYSGVQVPQ